MYIIKDCKKKCCLHYFGECIHSREAQLIENEIRCENYVDIYDMERELKEK